jgi:hypothetical protein
MEIIHGLTRIKLTRDGGIKFRNWTDAFNASIEVMNNFNVSAAATQKCVLYIGPKQEEEIPWEEKQFEEVEELSDYDREHLDDFLENS